MADQPWNETDSDPIGEVNAHQMKEKLFAWYDMQAKLKDLKTKEMALRKSLFGYYFPNPVEGTNDYELEDGYVLKGKYPIERGVEDARFRASLEEIRGQGINPESLVNYKPSLIKKNYNKMTDEERGYFDQFLIIKPGSPSMEVVLPAKNKPKGEDNAS